MSARVALVIGTRKGLFVARAGADRRDWVLDGPHLAGYEIQSAWLDPRDPRRGFAAAHHPVWGIHVHRSADAGASWEPLAEVPRHHEHEGPDSLRTIWCLAPGADAAPDTVLAAIEPPALFTSPDAGATWTRLPALDNHETAARWHPAKGGTALHSVARGPRPTASASTARSRAGGCYRSTDGGASWTPINAGVHAPLPARPVPGRRAQRASAC
ncbi:MAG: hypothetical protein U5K73_00280 [Halofilum sp. (in: g-proteobacteria)]|nr:hypothetical protein [Halofilum sp. (in: g-proteobacteria)]